MEEEVDENEDDGTVAGPEIPDDLEEGPEDDEEGRFFGGGISNDTAEVLNFIDERELDGSVVLLPGNVQLYLESDYSTRSKKRLT